METQARVVVNLSCLTPGITRRPKRLLEHNNYRVGGRVHAVVRRRRGDTFERASSAVLGIIPRAEVSGTLLDYVLE